MHCAPRGGIESLPISSGAAAAFRASSTTGSALRSLPGARSARRDRSAASPKRGSRRHHRRAMSSGNGERCRPSRSRLRRPRHRIYVKPINFPAVPCGTERLTPDAAAYRSGRRIAGQTGLADQLLRSVQWDSYPETAGRAAPPADALSAAAVQCHGGSPHRGSQPGYSLQEKQNLVAFLRAL
jgi:hypothetical protein